MQYLKDEFIYIQNDAKELCILNVEDGTIVEKIFHVKDFKQEIGSALGSAFSKMTKISKISKMAKNRTSQKNLGLGLHKKSNSLILQ